MMKHIVVYVHGKGGSAEEAEHYRPLFPDSEVIGFAYRAQTPWEAKEEFPRFFAAQRENCDRLTLIANSIGAFFALSSLDEALIDAAYLISPVADMEALIRNMMAWANVTERELAEKQKIPTAFGETLSWQYLCYVREHPVSWRVPTHILYGERDTLTSMETISAFAEKIGADLTVLPDGEHRFHTDAQLRFLDDWILNRKENGEGTERKETELLRAWKAEEDAAHIHGWDFSHIADRYTEETDLPWDYQRIVLERLRPEMKLLDIDTGGGEFLLSLHHPYANTSAAEAYPPNVRLCEQTLLPLGIDFRAGDGKDTLPFDDSAFDIVINRHGDFNVQDLHRMLKPGGLFITEQVGAENDRELVELLLGKTELPFPEQYLETARRQFCDAGFEMLDAQECFRPIKFFDIGALVWFARIIEWEFPGFSVDRCRENLLRAQKLLEQNGCVEGRIHRFLLVCAKR